MIWKTEWSARLMWSNVSVPSQGIKIYHIRSIQFTLSVFSIFRVIYDPPLPALELNPQESHKRFLKQIKKKTLGLSILNYRGDFKPVSERNKWGTQLEAFDIWTKLLLQMNMWKIIHLTCGELRYEFMFDHRSYTHNLSSCEINAWKNFLAWTGFEPMTAITVQRQ